MARVYRGYDEKLDRFAAVKVIDAALMASDSEEEYRQRFLREARAIARLRHPNIVGIYSFGDVDNLYYMVMEFVDGRDLAVLIRESTGFAPVQILRIIHDIAGALDYAHAGGVIHRDIKPSNIMVRPDGHAVLTDFGLALSVPEGSIGNTFGSAHYIAPEQAISSAQAVPQSDLYSLGVVLFQLLTGRVPFDDPSAMTVALKHLSDPPPSPRDYNPEISEAVAAVVLKMLEKEPQDRYASGEAFARALEVALGITASGEIYAPPGSHLTTSEMHIVAGNAASNTIAFRSDEPSEPLVQKPASKPSSPTSPTSLKPFPTIKPLSPEAYSGTSLRPPAPEYVGPEDEAPPKSPAPQARRRWWLAGIAALIVIAAAMAALSGGDTPAEVIASTTSIAGAAITPLTDTPPPTRATAAASAPPAVIATSAPPSVTSVPPTATHTSTRTPTETPMPTATEVTATLTTPPTVEPTPPPATETAAFLPNSVQLIYDGDTLVLRNPTADTVNISGLLFIQRSPGGDRAFFADLWAGGSRPVWALPSGDCFQVWRIELPERDLPAGCEVRHAWRSIASQRWFWLSDDPSATFEVRRGDEVLATCRVNIGTCIVPLSGTT